MGAESFPRTARLLRPAEFNALREEHSRFSSRYFHLQYRPATSIQARLGMAVSRRVSKRAVVRNRIKRQIRESFRLQRRVLPSVDALIIAKPFVCEVSNAALQQDLIGLWDKLVALKVNQPCKSFLI